MRRQRNPSFPPPNLANAAETAEHLRVLMPPESIGSPTALVALGDAAGRPIAHLHIVECDPEPGASDCAAVLDQLLDLPPDVDVGGLAVALTRAGGDEVQGYDRAWLRALHRVCHQRDKAAYGVFVVTRTAAREVQIDDAA